MKLQIIQVFFLVFSVSMLSAETNSYQRRGLGLDEPAAKSQKLPPLNYPMRGIPADSPKFIEVLALVNASLPAAKRVKNLPTVVEIIQSLPDGSYLAKSRNNPNSSTFQLTGAPTGSPDGASVECVLIEQNKTYQYTDTLGAVRTVRVYRFEPVGKFSDLLLPDAFIERLKAGVVFTVEKSVAPQSCKSCNGAGKIAITSGIRSQDGKKTCEICKGKGKVNTVQPILIKW